jgi:hypothetical protein
MNTLIVFLVGTGFGLVIGLTFFGCRAGAEDYLSLDRGLYYQRDIEDRLYQQEQDLNRQRRWQEIQRDNPCR